MEHSHTPPSMPAADAMSSAFGVVASTDADPVAKHKFAISPNTIRLSSCRCLRAQNTMPLVSASNQFDKMLERLDKVIGRLAGIPLHREIRDAGLRTLIELRQRGLELFHVIGYESSLAQGAKKRLEYSMVFAVPDQGGVAGHRAVAHLAVLFDCGGRFDRAIDSVTVRFEDDWDDWTYVPDWDYMKDTDAPKAERIDISAEAAQQGLAIEKIWQALFAMHGDTVARAQEVIAWRLDITLRQLRTNGENLLGFEIVQVFKGSSTGNTRPTIAIRLYTHADDDRAVANEAQTRAEGWEAKEDITIDERVAAVVLIEMGRKDQSSMAKRVAVCYDGEWPVRHRYRKDSGEPMLHGLEALLSE